MLEKLEQKVRAHLPSCYSILDSTCCLPLSTASFSFMHAHIPFYPKHPTQSSPFISQEACADRMSEIHKKTVTAFTCLECRYCSESVRQECRAQGHQTIKVCVCEEMVKLCGEEE